MSHQEHLIRKLYQTINLVGCESRASRTYGTGHELTASDIDLLKCVQRNEDAKASVLSRLLGVTNGAITQLAKKLVQMDYLEPYRSEGNKKEVYYRLTQSGVTACKGYDDYFAHLRQNIQAYIAKLDDPVVDQISGLFSVITDSISVGDHCSIKYGLQNDFCECEDDKKRCEKCQRAY